MPSEQESGSNFIVDLGGVKLPRFVEQQVEAEIQAAVLRALAETDFGGKRLDLLPDPQEPKDINPLDPRLGFVFYPPVDPAANPFTARDHTLMMKAIMEHPLQVLRYLPKKHKTRDGRPPGKEVLQAVLQIDQVDNHVKERIRTVLDVSPKLEEAQAALPESVKRAVDGLRRQLTSKTTVREKLNLLRDVRVRSGHREDGLADGMELAAQILEDGLDSIYSPDHSFYQLLQRGGSSRIDMGQVSDADQVGGVIGAVAGHLLEESGLVPPGTGIAVGGMAGAATASAAVLAGQLIGGIFDPIEFPSFE